LILIQPDLYIWSQIDHTQNKNIFYYVSKSLYFKVWEYAGLPNSFYKTYSIHNKKDYFIKEKWREIYREQCIFPSNYYQSGYIF